MLRTMHYLELHHSSCKEHVHRSVPHVGVEIERHIVSDSEIHFRKLLVFCVSKG
jgi:hypothetical protein